MMARRSSLRRGLTAAQKTLAPAASPLDRARIASYKGWRASLLHLLDEPGSSKSASCVFALIVLTIVASVLIFYLRTVPLLNGAGSTSEAVLRYAELVCAGIFSMELALRIITATLDPVRLCLADA